MRCHFVTVLSNLRDFVPECSNSPQTVHVLKRLCCPPDCRHCAVADPDFSDPRWDYLGAVNTRGHGGRRETLLWHAHGSEWGGVCVCVCQVATFRVCIQWIWTVLYRYLSLKKHLNVKCLLIKILEMVWNDVLFWRLLWQIHKSKRN